MICAYSWHLEIVIMLLHHPSEHNFPYGNNYPRTNSTRSSNNIILTKLRSSDLQPGLIALE